MFSSSIITPKVPQVDVVYNHVQAYLGTCHSNIICDHLYILTLNTPSSHLPSLHQGLSYKIKESTSLHPTQHPTEGGASRVFIFLDQWVTDEQVFYFQPEEKGVAFELLSNFSSLCAHSQLLLSPEQPPRHPSP